MARGQPRSLSGPRMTRWPGGSPSSSSSRSRLRLRDHPALAPPLHHLTLGGALETALLLLAVWSVWIYTTWAPNWLDPHRAPVRLMIWPDAAGLVMSTSIPDAFGRRGLVFAASFVAMHHVRSLFISVRGGIEPALSASFLRIWCGWRSGGLLDRRRVAAATGGWRLGGSRSASSSRADGALLDAGWRWFGDTRLAGRGEHFAERCGFFVIICLGESMLVSGATFAEADWTPTGVAAFTVNCLGLLRCGGSTSTSADGAARQMAHSADPGRLARVAFTYAHLPMVAGIIISAAADEMMIAHPFGHTRPASSRRSSAGLLCSSPGNLWFKGSTARVPPVSHVVGLCLFADVSLLCPVDVAARSRDAGAPDPGFRRDLGVAPRSGPGCARPPDAEAIVTPEACMTLW